MQAAAVGAHIISIHSTARVETDVFFQNWARSIHISIHSTARVETRPLSSDTPGSRYFNPLHREGGDYSPMYLPWSYSLFQSTPPRGWRLCFQMDYPMDMTFQSTPPRGWRPRSIRIRSARTYFNPLHREGGDAPVACCLALDVYFNPLHREGGDGTIPIGGNPPNPDFNPLHREGGDWQTQISVMR